MSRWTLLSRPGCELCEDFAQSLYAHLGNAAEVAVADVDSREDWQRRFGDRIPVLLDASGLPLMVAVFNPELLPRRERGV
jgi:hypothetical protein